MILNKTKLSWIACSEFRKSKAFHIISGFPGVSGFLAQLRDGYIGRDTAKTPAFQTVILAGVTDVKHLKGKIRSEDGHKVNSPWSKAADFTNDMSLSEDGIKGMLDEYEKDHHTCMDMSAIAKSIRAYTNRYPFLVSRICQLIDEEVSKTMEPTNAWTDRGIDEAVKMLLAEDNTLFQSLMKVRAWLQQIHTWVRKS